MKGLIAIAVALGLLSGCQCNRRKEAAKEGAVYEDDGARVNKTLGLITPEQFTGHIAAALGYDDPNAIANILEDKGVALGGIDFRTAKQRTHTPTGQSQLTIRRLAWDIAAQVVGREVYLSATEGKEPLVFTKCDINVDRPELPGDQRLPPEVQFAVGESVQRWRDQMEDLYWRLLARPPSEQEMVVMKDLFATTLDNENSQAAAWQAVLYVLLASMEYWNI